MHCQKSLLLAAVGSLFLTLSSPAQEHETNEEAIRNFGWMVAQQTVNPLEFTESEIAIFMEGFQKGSTEELGDPASMQQQMMEMSMYLQTRSQTIQQKAMEAAAAESVAFFAELDAREDVMTSESGLRYTILEPGEELKAGPADSVTVHYEGTLVDGTVFDSSMARGQPATFAVGGVVPGFGEGVQLVGKGGKARLYIPSELGYGPNGTGAIPPSSTLIFDIEIIEVIKAEQPAAEVEETPAATE